MWSSGQGQGFNQFQQSDSNTGEWQGLQQAPLPTNTGGQVPFQQAPFPFQEQKNQYHGQCANPGYSGVQYGGPASSFAPGQQPQYQQQQQQQQQQQFLYQQELERRAQEEQRQRDLEIQRRKMKNMDISKPASVGTALEDLIALPTSKSNSSGSPLISRTQIQPSPPVFRASQPPQASGKSIGIKTYSPSSKARAWTADTASLEGVFAQHSHAQNQQEDDFGEFHSGPSFPAQVPRQGMQGPGQAMQGPGQIPSQQAFLSSVTQANQHPIPSTSISGITKEGYMSSDVMHTRAYETPISIQQTTSNRTHPPPAGGTGTADFPPLYKEVYGRCSQRGDKYVSTELVFPILLSSQLPTTVLRDLWTVANKEVPGKLTQMELYVLLGLIGLVQSGNPSPTLDDLKKVPLPPIPNLQMLQQQPTAPPRSVEDGTSEFGDFQQGQLTSVAPANSGSTAQPEFSKAITTAVFGDITTTNTSTSIAEKYSVFSDITATSTSTSTSTADKYSVFSDITATSTSTSTSTADKYSVFSDIAATSTSTSTSTADKYSVFSDITTADKSSEMTNNTSLSKPTSSEQTLFSQSSALGAVSTVQHQSSNFESAKVTTGTSNEDADEFGSFLSGPQPLLPFSSTASQNQTWASFPQHPLDSTATVSTTTISIAALLPLSADVSSTSNAFQSSKDISTSASKPSPTIMPKQTASLEILSKDELPDLTKKLTSLETLDKDALPKLTKKLTSLDKDLSTLTLPEGVPSSNLDNFGDFESYGGFKVDELGSTSGSTTSFTKATADPGKVWSTCLDKCLEVLSSCAAIFESVEEQTILTEIVQSEEGRQKLRDIACKEVTKNIREKWRTLVRILPEDIMEQLYKETVPVLSEEKVGDGGDFLSDTISKCSLCMIGKEMTIPAASSLTGCAESYSLSLVFHEGQMCHSTCANFWINVVQEKLPDFE